MPATAPRRGRASQKQFSPHGLRHALPLICWKPAPTCVPFSYCWGTPTLKHTTVYLHLSQRHLHAMANPLDSLPAVRAARRSAAEKSQPSEPADP